VPAGAPVEDLQITLNGRADLDHFDHLLLSPAASAQEIDPIGQGAALQGEGMPSRRQGERPGSEPLAENIEELQFEQARARHGGGKAGGGCESVGVIAGQAEMEGQGCGPGDPGPALKLELVHARQGGVAAEGQIFDPDAVQLHLCIGDRIDGREEDGPAAGAEYGRDEQNDPERFHQGTLFLLPASAQAAGRVNSVRVIRNLV